MRHKKKRGSRSKKRLKMIEARKKHTYINSKGKVKIWSQEYVANQIFIRFGKKVTAQHISMIEGGRNNPSCEFLKMLSVVLEIPIEDFY